MKFDSDYFPKYHLLSIIEKLFLRTCCYFPPLPRNESTLEAVSDLKSHIQTYEKAFGAELWSIIKDKKVLDLGCGAGGYAIGLSVKGASQVVGLDIHPRFLLAKQESEKRGYNNLFFIQGTTNALPDNSFDVVISHDSFEHFEEPEKMLAEMCRITKAGGYIFIKFGPTWGGPFGRHMSGTIRKDRPWIHLIVPERIIMHCHSVYHNDPFLKGKIYAAARWLE